MGEAAVVQNTQSYRGSRHVTDKENPTACGIVIKCSGTAVVILDQRTNLTHRIPHARAIPASEEQVEHYTALPLPNEIPAQERLKRRLEVKASWNDDDEHERRR